MKKTRWLHSPVYTRNRLIFLVIITLFVIGMFFAGKWVVGVYASYAESQENASFSISELELAERVILYQGRNLDQPFYISGGHYIYSHRMEDEFGRIGACQWVETMSYGNGINWQDDYYLVFPTNYSHEFEEYSYLKTDLFGVEEGYNHLQLISCWRQENAHRFPPILHEGELCYPVSFYGFSDNDQECWYIPVSVADSWQEGTLILRVSLPDSDSDLN